MQMTEYDFHRIILIIKSHFEPLCVKKEHVATDKLLEVFSAEPGVTTDTIDSLRDAMKQIGSFDGKFVGTMTYGEIVAIISKCKAKYSKLMCPLYVLPDGKVMVFDDVDKIVEYNQKCL